jgi:hypothetical protein
VLGIDSELLWTFSTERVCQGGVGFFDINWILLSFAIKIKKASTSISFCADLYCNLSRKILFHSVYSDHGKGYVEILVRRYKFPHIRRPSGG